MVSPNLERRALLTRLTFAVAIAVTGSACDSYVTVNGVVRDSAGAPLQDVAVELETTGRAVHPAKTASDGSFDVGIVGAEWRKTSISFRKDGYQDMRRGLAAERSTINVTLRPLPAQ